MADNKKDVELRIRARDYSQKTFKELIKVYTALTKVQETQADAAEKGEASARDLEATYKRLEDAGRALLKLDSLTKMYGSQTAALQQAIDKTSAARLRQQELAEALAKTENASKRQQQQVVSATKAVESANKAEQKRRESLANTATQLERYGVEVADIAGAQKQFIEGVNSVNSALERQEKAMEGLAANQAAAKMRQQAKRDADAEVAATEKVITSLKRQADQAAATAQGYRTLGRVVSTTTGTYDNLGREIQSIIAPSESARRTLSGLEKQISDTAGKTDSLIRNTAKAKDAMRQLGQAQQRLIGMSSLIDTFNAQNAAIRRSRTEYNAARAELRELSAQIGQAGVDYAQLSNRIQASQQRITTASQALRSQTEAARRTQAALRDAGVETNKLAQAQQRLVSSANQSVTAVQRLSNAVRNNSNNTKNGAQWTRYFTDSNRESLSMFQRVRGELIALATAYVGLQGVINLAGGAVDAYKVRQQTLIKLSKVVGSSQEAIASEWQYIVDLADALGLKVENLAASYSKFAIAGKEVGLTLQETKFIFESVAKAARVFQLSTDDTQGVFRALEQILGKGQVYAEELRGQLGERLPAAVALFAKGMGITIAELQKQLEAGAVGADEVINFAREQGNAIAKQLDEAAKGLGAAEARLANAQFQFRLAIADAGFIDSYTNLIIKLTDFLQSEQGTALAEKLATVFSAVADAIIWAADNTDTLVAVFSTLVAIKAATWLGAIIVSLFRAARDVKKLVSGLGSAVGIFGTTATASGAAAGKLGLLAGAFRLLLRAIPLVGAALIAWDIGSIIYQQSETARNAIDSLIHMVKGIPIIIAAAFKTIPALLTDLTVGPLAVIEKALRDGINGIVSGLESLARKLPKVGDIIGDAIRDSFSVAEGVNRAYFQDTFGVWEEAGRKWDEHQKGMVEADKSKYDAMIKQAVEFSDRMEKITGVGLPKTPKPKGGEYTGPTRPPGFSFTEDPGTGPTPRERQIRALTMEFEKLAKAAEKANKSAREAAARSDLPSRLALIDEEFAPQMQKAQGIGGAEGQKLIANLQKIIELRKESERIEFEALQRSGEDKRANRIAKLREEYERLFAEIGVKDAQIDPTQTFDDRMSANLAKMEAQYAKLQGRAAQIGGPEGAQFAQQFDDLKKLNAELVVEQTRLAEIKNMEEQLSAQLNTKKYLIAEVNSMREAGLISESESAQRILDINAANNAGIAESIRLLEEFALKMATSLTPEALARINAEIAAMRAGLADVSGTFTTMDTTVAQGALQGIQSSMRSVVEELTRAAVGVQSWSDAFRNAGAAVAQFFADFLVKIAEAILQQTILNALANSGWGGVANAAVSLGGTVAAGASHNGSIIGDKSSGTGFQNRGQVPVSWFAGAKRYHSGGLPGLRQDEVPTILQKGEQVLSKDDPNNILNRTNAPAGGGSAPDAFRFVLVDDRTKIPEAMNGAEGEKVIMQVLRRNGPTVRSIIG